MTTAELPKVTPVRRARGSARDSSSSTASSRARRSPAPGSSGAGSTQAGGRRGGRGKKPAATARASAPSWLGRTPVAGPRIRLGVLWFLLAVSAATAGRWASAAIWGATAVVAAGNLVEVWRVWGGVSERSTTQRLVAGLLAGSATAAAAIGTGVAGAALVVVGLVAVGATVVLGRRRRPSPELPLASVLPVLACAPVILVVVESRFTAIFLIGAVSLYDAGNFLVGAQARRAWEGPIVGIIGVLAVTFTMAAFAPAPFDATTAWITGLAVAVACPLGQVVLTALLPQRDSIAVRARRIDTYIVAAPLFLTATWIVA